MSSSITTPTFRRRLAETSISDINHSSVIQEHFVYLNQQLCSNCSKCSCYQTFIRNQIELEYLSICSYNEQLKSENDLLQRLLADCKYSYEKQYVRFSQYEQYLIEYEQCIQIQYELIRTFQQLIDRFQITIDKRKRNDDDNQNNNNHIYQKINETTSGLINQESEHIELYRLITSLYEQCQRHISQLPKRAQLFSYSHEEFHPPPNISGVVDVADLEISVLFVDLLTLKHENSELRWYNERLLREKKVSKTKVDLYELTNKYFQSNNDEMNSTHDELIQREKTLRLYVHRLYDLLETTSNQLKERQIHEENLLYQFRLRNRELIEQIRRFRRSS